MNAAQVWLTSYLHPRKAMDVLAEWQTPRRGALYVLCRGVLLSLFFFLPFHLLRFEPITPAYLEVFDTPDYFLYAVFIWPVFLLLSWVYLAGAATLLLRLPGYPANFDQVLNLNGLLGLTVGVVILAFDWLMVAIQFHANAVFMGVAHILIADPWTIALTSIFYRKYFGVPIWLSVLVGIAARILYIPLAIVFIRT